MPLIDSKSGKPLYDQLYTRLKEQILSGNIAAGQRLPATRALASEYRLSRNTVIRAYQQLEVEGYVRPVTGSGYYVEDIAPFWNGAAEEARIPAAPPGRKAEEAYDFCYGDLDMNLYSSKAWRKCLKDAFDGFAARGCTEYGDPQGSPELRRVLGGYLSLSRGVRCSAEQIVLTSGHQQSVRLVADLLAGSGRTFAMEEPGYNGTRQIMEQRGWRVVPVPVEEDGVSVDAARELSHALLYVTPSHQFPLGSVLPIAKRLRLLEWAETRDGYILEDDYDSELRYHNRPVPALQSVDAAGRTIYLGTFSKSLSPDLRIAYVVLPADLLAVYRDRYQSANCTVPALFQRALAAYISGGAYQRHINAMRAHYRKKHDFIRQYVKENLQGRASLIGEDAGLHFVLSVRTEGGVSGQDELAALFARRGVRLYPTAPFWIDKAGCPAGQLLLGFGAVPSDRLPDAMERIAAAVRAVSPAPRGNVLNL